MAIGLKGLFARGIGIAASELGLFSRAILGGTTPPPPPVVVVQANSGSGPDGGWLPWSKKSGKTKRFDETEWRRPRVRPTPPPPTIAGPPRELVTLSRLLDQLDE